MQRALTIFGVALVLGIGVIAAVALGAGGSGKTTSTSSSGTEAAPAKVWLCHHTGSWKHPYHLIHVSAHAVSAHRRHGDVDPGSGSSCPTTQPAGAKAHGNSGAHDKIKQGEDSKPD